MNSHEHAGIPRPCAASLAGPCDARHAARRARQPVALTYVVPVSAGHQRVRCRALRTPPGYLAQLGSCWYRRFPWSPVTWRLDGPHR